MNKFIYTDKKLNQLWSKVTCNSRFIIEDGEIKIYLTKYNLNQEVIVFEFNQLTLETLRGSQGFSIEKKSIGGKSILRIGNKKEQTKFSDMFFLFIADLLNLSNDSQNLALSQRINLIVMRIKAWQKFMKSDGGKFTIEQEIGLFGELLVLDFLIDKEIIQSSIAKVWNGPIRGARDFYISPDVALEVKTSLLDNPFIAKISSLDQLNNCDIRHVYLVAVKVQEDNAGRTVADLASIIKDKLKDPFLIYEFDSLLVVSGYVENKMSRPLMKLTNDFIKAYDVETIPRLLPTTVKGIIHARYEIKLIDAQDPSVNYPYYELGSLFH